LKENLRRKLIPAKEKSKIEIRRMELIIQNELEYRIRVSKRHYTVDSYVLQLKLILSYL